MLRYSSHLPSKVAIDRLQTRFHCCGRVNYSEWFFIPWHDGGKETALLVFIFKTYTLFYIKLIYGAKR